MNIGCKLIQIPSSGNPHDFLKLENSLHFSFFLPTMLPHSNTATTANIDSINETIQRLLQIVNDPQKSIKLKSEIVSELDDREYTEIYIDRAIEDAQARLQWGINSQCEVYSRSSNKLCDGIITKIYIDDEDQMEWLTVKYNGTKKKKIQRFCGDFRPIGIENDDYEFKDEVMEYIIEKLKMFDTDTILHDENGNPVLHLRTIHKLVSDSSLCNMLNVPAPICLLVSEYSLSEMKLEMDPTMIESVSCSPWGYGFDVGNLCFRHGNAYCTKATTDCEIVIHLSSKNHIAQKGEIGDEDGFVITEIGVMAPQWGYTAPIQKVFMWTFYDSEGVPDALEIKVCTHCELLCDRNCSELSDHVIWE